VAADFTGLSQKLFEMFAALQTSLARQITFVFHSKTSFDVVPEILHVDVVDVVDGHGVDVVKGVGVDGMGIDLLLG